MDIKRIEPREWNSRAVVYENLVFLSGMVADDKSVPVKQQTEQVLGKIDEFCGGTLAQLRHRFLKAGHAFALSGSPVTS